MSLRKRILSAIILLFWFAMLGMLVERTYLRPTSVVALDAATSEGVRPTDEWFGIYQKGRKIGFAHTQIRPEEETYRLTEESELDILALGSVQHVKTVITSFTTKNFLLKYFDFLMQSGATTMTVKGAVLGRKIVLDITTGGSKRTETVVLKDPPYLSPNIKPAVLLAGLEAGKRYRFPVFNPATMGMEEADISVESKETIKIGGGQQTVYKLREAFQGMETTSWINQDGETLKEESALGYVLLKENMSQARNIDQRGPVVDVIEMTMIPSDPVKDSVNVRFLRARLKGVALESFQLDKDRQQQSGEVVQISAESPSSSYRLPCDRSDLRGYLRATALIQSDDRKIIDRTDKILAGEKDAVQAAKKINSWVYNSVVKKPVVSIPSAIEVLSHLEGDCNEHTALFTALARAAGIPARPVAGIVYMDNGFYYHAWPEIWLGTWIAVDPTLNQFPADATHIRFASGELDSQAGIAKLIGKLRIEILEYR